MEDHAELVGRAFVDRYDNLFDHDRALLSSLYHPTSMLTFEGQQVLGVDGISKKLIELPFGECKHVVSTVDSQPSFTDGGIVVLVNGSLGLPGEEHPLRFSQVMYLLQLLYFKLAWFHFAASSAARLERYLTL